VILGRRPSAFPTELFEADEASKLAHVPCDLRHIKTELREVDESPQLARVPADMRLGEIELRELDEGPKCFPPSSQVLAPCTHPPTDPTFLPCHLRDS